jgi:hypothetical protein
MKQETKTCQNCKQSFTIAAEDFAFYERIAVPPPTWCPECRLMRRLTWRNERALYKRTCSLCGAGIIAMYPADAPHPVYCRECWYSDKWDATVYGRDYDFSRPFFNQFHDLLLVVPQIALQVSNSPGSDYVNQVANCKDCYLVTSGSDNEACMYCYRILNSKNVIDSGFGRQLEFCYEAVQCRESANSTFNDSCIASTDLQFCSDVRGSQSCFMSANIRHKSYMFRGAQLTKERFDQRMDAIDKGSYKNLEQYRTEYAKLREGRLHKFMLDQNSTNCSGNWLANCAESRHCFIGSNLERCKYGLMVANAKDCYDVNNGCCTMELAYECSTVGVNTYHTKLSADVWPDVRDATYSQSCRNDANQIFGCVSLRKKEYCILNKQYVREEYEKLVRRIIEHMDTQPYVDRKGRVYKYGEFFPSELSLFAYNETSAHDYFPRTEKQVEDLGLRWRVVKPEHYATTISAKDLPDHINDVSDDIVDQIVGCLHEGKCGHQCPAAFRITPNELQFYRQKKIALPRLCPNCRHYERFAMTNPYKLWHRKCQCSGKVSENRVYTNTIAHQHHGAEKCPNEFETSYAPERKEIVYCEQCYNAEVV